MIEWIKWASTIILVIGTGINAAGFYPAGPIILIIGGIGWLIVARMWQEPTLVITNAFIAGVGILGLFWHYLVG